MTFGRENELLDPQNIIGEVLQGRKCACDRAVGRGKGIRLLEG